MNLLYLKRLALAAGLVVSSVAISAGPAAASTGGQNVGLSVTASFPNAISPTDVLWVPGATITYTLTLQNNSNQQVRVCEVGPLGKPLCFLEPQGVDVSGVVVKAGPPVLNPSVPSAPPAPAIVLSASGDSGFVCSVSGGAVTCTGALPANGTAHVTIVVGLPSAAASYNITESASVAPNAVSTVVSQTTTVWFCPPTCIG
jgi:hypothetical protein